ncbi:nucleotide-binding protein [Saccharibacillus sp. CPCC 101409]|uniref:nucleotide-binding protein n=1 Tax=Saccharibacillus sp. CPCC 101409 TaxID=3058041 RepID=UPI0026713903|nr:nucleotide-binding protein [Saccharibacillus sp. CPCC 101409]MDO3408270.1 nucleotide-binding protein [Saccharibacillus sp. CPCC 101409]
MHIELWYYKGEYFFLWKGKIMSDIKPKVFIGSSAEVVKDGYVGAVARALTYHAEVTPWTSGVFQVNNATMDDLEKQVEANDFAVFVLAADDVVNLRGDMFLTPRDNTTFELGLFWGKLKRERVFFIMPAAVSEVFQETKLTRLRIPSDLHGLTPLYYDANTENKDAAVFGACDAIAAKINDLQKFVSSDHYPLINFLTQFSKELLLDPKGRYNHLYEALRTAYYTTVIPEASVSGAAVWLVREEEGIEQVAGNVGRGRFYKFKDYISKNKDIKQAPSVMNVHLSGTEQAIKYDETGVANVYLLCYPVSKNIVVTIHITVNGRRAATGVIERLMDVNEELMNSINYVFGGEGI